MASVVIIIILLVISLGNTGKKPAVKTAPKNLSAYVNTDSFVRMVVDGPVSANETHYQVQISVNRERTVYEQINGYDGNVIKSVVIDNNQNSYSNFLNALEKAGYMQGDKLPEHANYQGYCPLGTRYIFSLHKGSERIQQFWETSCGSPKTYLGNLSLTIKLFEAQVPNYSEMTNAINL